MGSTKYTGTYSAAFGLVIMAVRISGTVGLVLINLMKSPLPIAVDGNCLKRSAGY